MKAIVVHEHGDADKLIPENRPDPEPGPGEVVVAVRACALNHLDLWMRRGIPGVKLPRIPGSDISGAVAKVGPNVEGVRAGDRVYLSPGVGCGACPACLSGRDNMCPAYDFFGVQRDGGYAEFVLTPAHRASPIPGDLSFDEAAAFPLVFLTAYHMLVTRAQIRPGEDALVMAAGSGVGTAAIQVAKLAGARVIAAAGSDAKLSKAKELGADEGINYETQDLISEVRRLTDRRGVDVVIEHTGAQRWEAIIRSMATGGRLVTCGATSGAKADLDLRHLFARQLNLLGSFMGRRTELPHVARLVGERKLHPIIDRALPLSGAREAHRLIERREQFGKVLLHP